MIVKAEKENHLPKQPIQLDLRRPLETTWPKIGLQFYFEHFRNLKRLYILANGGQ